ncbi:MAG TPA: hypothetical protein VNV37_02480, partial [Solirubrobacteraceae bacterium]|nr:hypothetical protein [Solirubrobacteraceae bacterium]
MRFCTDVAVRSPRIWLVVLLACAGLGVLAPSSQAAEALSVESLFAGNCKEGFKACNKAPPGATPAEEIAKAEKEGYTQAAGHPPFGVTEFKVASVGEPGQEVPLALLTHVRTDVGPGVSTNPEAVEKCSLAEFGEEEPFLPGKGLYLEPTCTENNGEKEGTEIGENKVLVALELAPKVFVDEEVKGTVYNLVQPNGLASDFGVALKLPKYLTEAELKKAFVEGGHPLKAFPGLEEKLEKEQYYAHTFIEGHVEWAKEPAGTDQGNYHNYYEINVSPTLPVISSRLTLFGNIGTTKQGGFITNPSHCAGAGAATLNKVTLTSLEGHVASREYIAPVGTKGCTLESPFLPVPFEPTFSLTTETTQSDQPTGMTTTLTVPHATGAEEKDIDSSQLDNAIVTLPEGMTLNPSAAHGLEACRRSQIGLGTRNKATCPYGSKIGTVTINVPDLPPESLKGNIYLGESESGGSESGQITSQPYTIYLNAESERYGVTVRVKGTVEGNETTGRVVAKFEKTP